MTQIVPLHKQSKKKQRAYYARQRGSWNGLHPATRIAPNGKAYLRSRARQEVRRAQDLT